MTHGKTYNKSPRRINHKATKSKTNTGTTALERSVEQTTGGFNVLLQLPNFTLGPDATVNTKIHKNSVCVKAPNSVNASKRKHKNQINHYNKQRRVLMANSTVCQSKWKPIVEPRRAKVSGRSHQNWRTYGDDKVRNRHFQQSRGHNFMTDRFTSPVFALIVAFIPDLQVRKLPGSDQNLIQKRCVSCNLTDPVSPL